METILLILDNEKNYYQKLNQYESIDVNKFVKSLEKKYKIEILTFSEVEKIIDNIKNRKIIYTSNQNQKYKKYIEDIMYILNKKNLIIPSYDLLLGHENKGFQELERKIKKYDGLKSTYFTNLNDFNLNDLKYPIVLKKTSSSGSKGVYLVNNKTELLNNFKKLRFKDILYYKLKIKRLVKYILKKDLTWIENRIKDYEYNSFIVQEFLPNLDGDFKVLIFGSKYYVLKRGLKKGDFRASGSGIFNFDIEPPIEVLNFSKLIKEKIDSPFLGLDIAIDSKKKCYLVEYQGIHIGPATLIKSSKYYKYENKKWQKYEGKSVLEEEYANAIMEYIEHNNI